MVIKFGKWLTRHKAVVLIIAFLLLIPATIGYVSTRINYDLLSYLPNSLETVSGQDTMVDEFGMGAFSMIVVEDMELKDVAALKEKIEAVDHVKKVLWYDSVLDVSVPVEMLPKDLREAFFNGDATMMIALFDNTTSSETSMEAVTQIRKITSKNCFVSGMTGIVTDIKQIALKEMPIYVVIASCLSLIVLLLAMDSLVVPVLFLLCIGVAVLYNLGSNIFLGQISYITQALTAVLQLGVTMDYSIFLLNSYEENKKRFEGDKERAMAHAINATFKSVIGSSITTVAGFIALCFMTFTLGLDLGIVMAKGVVIGVIGCVTILPSMILTFDRALEKTMHKEIMPAKFDKLANFVVNHAWLPIIVFLVLLFPAIYGYNHTNVYYNLTDTFPESTACSQANKILEENFDMNSVYMILADTNMTAKDATKMLDELENVEGVSFALGYNSLAGTTIPDELIPDDLKDMLKGNKHQMIAIGSDYKLASDEINNQISTIDAIAKKYDQNSMVIGEAPCTKDLITITDKDFKTVSAVSIVAIFIIIFCVFKSVSLPIILVAAIEFAIFINMGLPYYLGTTLPFIASVVIGTIQLGATVDYAILMTTRYKKERNEGAGKKEAIATALSTSIPSIIVSALGFFAATFGVGAYSSVDMVASLCKLMSRGAIISMFVVIFVLPSFFVVFDKVIRYTSIGFGQKDKKEKAKNVAYASTDTYSK